MFNASKTVGERSKLTKSFSPTLLAFALTLGIALPSLAQQRSSTNNGANSGSLENAAANAMRRGDFQSAIENYGKLVKESPRSAEFQFQLGAATYWAGHPQNAIQPLREALKLKPDLAEAQYFLGASLAETGNCQEAIPDLKRAVLQVKDKDLLRRMGVDGVNCSMGLDQQDSAIDFLRMLRHNFPKNPEVLYLSVHVFSDLSTRASQALLTADPGSYQVHELYAEALESQGKWDEAEAEYKKVLEMKPDLPGIHFLIGRLILTKPKTDTTFEDAKKEFEAELRIDPRNAGAEFVLGKLALRTRDYETAVSRFSKASANDPHFADAKIELGRALISLHEPAKAIPPLESAVKLQPQNPSTHYLLAMAYRGAGRLPDAQKELAEYKKATENNERTNQDIRSGIIGRKSPAQLSEESKQPEH